MNNSHKKISNRPRRPSIDGFTSSGGSRFSLHSDKPNNDFGSRVGSSQESATIDEFRRKDGFHPTTQRSIVNNNSEDFFVDRRNVKVGGSKKKRFSLRKSKKSDKQKKPLKKRIIRGILIFLTIVLLVGGFLFFKGYITLHKILRGGGSSAALSGNADPSKLNGEGDGRVNILLLGRGGEGHDGADLTDTIILASIDPIAKEAALLSVPRDLYVKVPDYGSMKINSVFAEAKGVYLNKQDVIGPAQVASAENAGFDKLEQILEDTLGVPIHYHFMVDFTGFKQAVDNVGGVRVNAPQAVAEQMRIDGQNYYLDIKPGEQDMDGFKALAYARSRHTSPRGDFDRAERQRLIISALKDKILSASTLSNPQKISNLLNTFGNHLQTNFSIQDMQRLQELAKSITSDKITSIGLADPPNNYVKTANIGGLSVVIPTAGIYEYSDIQYFVRNALKDSYIKNENANIMVLNGTNTAGLATQKGQELKSFGYNITKVDNAPTRTYSQTIIVDLRNGNKKYTKNYLEKRFKVSTVGSIPDSTITVDPSVDFVIILGSDQANL